MVHQLNMFDDSACTWSAMFEISTSPLLTKQYGAISSRIAFSPSQIYPTIKAGSMLPPSPIMPSSSKCLFSTSARSFSSSLSLLIMEDRSLLMDMVDMRPPLFVCGCKLPVKGLSRGSIGLVGSGAKRCSFSLVLATLPDFGVLLYSTPLPPLGKWTGWECDCVKSQRGLHLLFELPVCFAHRAQEQRSELSGHSRCCDVAHAQEHWSEQASPHGPQ